MRFAPLAAALILTACDTGSDDTTDDGTSDADVSDFVGIYEVVAEDVAADCLAWESVELPIPYFSLLEGEEAGTLEFRICRKPDDCDRFDSEERIFRPDGDDFVDLFKYGFYNADGGVCVLGATRNTITVKANGDIRILREKAEVGSQDPSLASDDACDAAVADHNPLFPKDGRIDCRRYDGKATEPAAAE